MSARVIAAVAPLAVVLGPHVLAALLALTLAAVAGILAFGILPVVLETGWGVVPVPRRAPA